MKKKLIIGLFAGSLVLTGIVAALLVDIFTKKQEGRQYPLMLAQQSDDDVNPEKWGLNFPSEYDSYQNMQQTNQPTAFGGSLPYSRLIRYPQLTALWAGYPFSADFNEERGHYYAQIDQIETKRNNKEWLNAHGFPKFTGQPGACMNCHSGWTPSLIRELGWMNFNKTPYQELSQKLIQAHGDGIHGGKLGGTCADCHHPEDMSLRVTRPAYINAMVTRGYEADAKSGIKAPRQAMRSHVCQQCHVEYYFKKGSSELTFPWAKWLKDQPLQIEMIEEYYNEIRKDKELFQYDWIHKDTGAAMLKVQHPETELTSSGIHARSGVACADCHMPYQREGAVKVTNHHIRSPLFDIKSSCQTCHSISEDALRDRVDFIQNNTARELREAESAILALISDVKRSRELIQTTAPYKSATTAEAQEAILAPALADAREFHRRASLRWDFIASENSTGFHSDQEAARVLAQAIDLARQGQLALVKGLATLQLQLDSLTLRGESPAAPQPIADHHSPVGDIPPRVAVERDSALQGNAG